MGLVHLDALALRTALQLAEEGRNTGWPITERYEQRRGHERGEEPGKRGREVEQREALLLGEDLAWADVDPDDPDGRREIDAGVFQELRERWHEVQRDDVADSQVHPLRGDVLGDCLVEPLRMGLTAFDDLLCEGALADTEISIHMGDMHGGFPMNDRHERFGLPHDRHPRDALHGGGIEDGGSPSGIFGMMTSGPRIALQHPGERSIRPACAGGRAEGQPQR